MAEEEPVFETTTGPPRIITAASLFDGHDAVRSLAIAQVSLIGLALNPPDDGALVIILVNGLLYILANLLAFIPTNIPVQQYLQLSKPKTIVFGKESDKYY